MHSMYDISWPDIKEKLKFKLKCMLNIVIATSTKNHF
jgi:hypothetical protein